ncbi:MAG: hypothetical protein KKB50_08605 [Planctomycetes bacterium]|nr:hypothetical protein [Planctomycetota bacterium]
MPGRSQGYPYAAGAAAVTRRARDPLGVEARQTIGRWVVEALLYATLLNSTFYQQLGWSLIPYAGGAPILAAGLLTFLIMLIERERVPLSLWFALLMNVTANVSQVFGNSEPVLFGEGLPPLLHWLCQLAMVCYLIRNSGAQKRMLLFFSALLLVIVAIGGAEYVQAKTERLDLEQVGGGFANANRLAYVTGLLAMGLVFWSLRANKLLRPALWGLALALTVIMFRTVSRGGILTFGCGLAVLVLAIAAGRGVRLGGVILILVIVAAVSQVGFLLTESTESFRERLDKPSVRTQVYSVATLQDLARTIIVGTGHSGAYTTAAGITAHNSFVYTHMALGGITGWPYLIWLMLLSLRVYRMVRAPDLPFDLKMQVVCLFGMGLGSQVLSNQGYLFLTTIYATALTEKYTAPYSRRSIAARSAAWRQVRAMPAAVPR